ncbi:MAG: hypothetical protein ABWX61_10685 [Paenisporosarcina sp.]
MEKKSNDSEVKYTQTKIHEVNITEPIGNELSDEQKKELHVKDGQNNHNVDERGGY